MTAVAQDTTKERSQHTQHDVHDTNCSAVSPQIWRVEQGQCEEASHDLTTGCDALTSTSRESSIYTSSPDASNWVQQYALSSKVLPTDSGPLELFLGVSHNNVFGFMGWSVQALKLAVLIVTFGVIL